MFIDENTGLRCEMEGEVEKRKGTFGQVQECPGEILRKSVGGETRAGEVYSERTVGKWYRSVSPGDSMGADGAGVYRAWVGMNITADEKKHKDKKQR